jgi:hypothetical protein
MAVLPPGWLAAGSSVARAAGVVDRRGPEWTTLAVTTAVRLGAVLPTGAGRAVYAVGGGSVPYVTL